MIMQCIHAALTAALVAEASIPATDAPPPTDAPTPVVQDEEPLNDWTGAIALGIFQAFGNTERTNANMTADGKLRREDDRFTLGAWWYYAEEENDAGTAMLTDRRYGASAKYDYFLSEKSYLLANALGERDDKAAITLRTTAGVGYGYQFKEEEDFKLSGELGVQYFVQDFKTPDPTIEEPNPEVLGAEGYAAARAAYNVEWKPGGAWILAQTGEAYPSLEDSDDFYSKLDTRLRYDLSAALFGQFQWLWDYNNVPAPGKEQSDHRLALTVGYSF